MAAPSIRAVGELLDNRGKSHVLMLAGEILIGGKQDRVLRQDVLLPPLWGPRQIGVFCVEQGRWAGSSAQCRTHALLAQPSLRQTLMDGAGQRDVWKEVDRAARAAAPPARTRDTLRAIAGAHGATHLNAGVGHVFEFSVVNARGSALVAESEVVHLALLQRRRAISRASPLP